MSKQSEIIKEKAKAAIERHPLNCYVDAMGRTEEMMIDMFKAGIRFQKRNNKLICKKQ